jgi:hypothetical protein
MKSSIMKKLMIIGAGFFLIPVSALLSAEPLRAKAGAYYFDGWAGTWHITERLKTEFFDREPVWGWRDDSPEIMEQQIEFAANNGLAFFAFDWYYPEEQSKETLLNTGLNLYLKAKNKSKLEFCLLVANHAGFIIRPGDWEAVCSIWLDLFKDPMHLKVNGEPLIIFFSPNGLIQEFGGPVKTAEALRSLEDRARKAGLKGVAFAACCTPGPENKWTDLQQLSDAGFEYFTGYNYPGYPVKGKVKIQAFKNLMEGHEDIWNRFAQKAVRPYIPVVTVGWDKRPWEDLEKPESHGVYYPDRTPPQVNKFVKKAVEWLDANPDKTISERIILLYAWNENGEGGYLTPTKSQGDAFLKAVHEALKP